MLISEKVIILVPIYKETMNPMELISLTQLKKVMGKYEICFVAPQSLSGFRIEGIRNELFPDAYFESIDSYNRLMLSSSFYSRFLQYKYMLIYQLDAFVFEDRLQHFCSLGYDYIGAPWLRGMSQRDGEKMKFFHVGNGGLSLRNIQNTIKLLNRNNSENDFQYENNEDGFFASKNGIEYKVAPIEVALQFSFESEVKRCYYENAKELPMGCHAWWRYDLDFWRPYIEKEGYVIPNICGDEDYNNKESYEKQYKKMHFWTSDVISVRQEIRGGRIVLWGYGIIGSRMEDVLEKADLEIYRVVDLKKCTTCENVFNPNTIECAGDTVVIICTGDEAQARIRDILTEKGYVYHKDCFCYYDTFNY